MRVRLLAAVGATALALAVLPALGAAADELPNGEYTVVTDDGELVVTATDDGVVVTGGSPSSLQLVVDDVTYELTPVADGGWAVDVVEDEEPADDGTEEPSEGGTEEPSEGAEEPTEGGTEEPTEGGTQEPSESDTDEDDPDEDDGDEDDGDGDGDDRAEAGHGAVVSAVAACAPRGRQARDAGWPNHGTFVRAAAQGDPALGYEVTDPGTGEVTAATADLSTADGAAAFCAEVAAALADDQGEDDAADTGADGAEETTAESSTADEPADSPGRSAQAPGQQRRPDHAGIGGPAKPDKPAKADRPAKAEKPAKAERPGRGGR